MSKSSRRKRRVNNHRPTIVANVSGQTQTPAYSVSPVIQSSTVIRTVASSFTGPTPPPQILEEYERICPGSAKLIFENFEKQADHRRRMEISQLDYAMKRSNWGLACGTAIVFSVLALGGYAVHCGQNLAASAAFIAPVVSLAWVFVAGRKQQSEERTVRAKLMNRKS